MAKNMGTASLNGLMAVNILDDSTKAIFKVKAAILGQTAASSKVTGS